MNKRAKNQIKGAATLEYVFLVAFVAIAAYGIDKSLIGDNVVVTGSGGHVGTGMIGLSTRFIDYINALIVG